MSIDITTISNVLSNLPLGALYAYQWYVDYPTDSNAEFGPTGYFDVTTSRPWGLAYELHNMPADAPFDWLESVIFRRAYAQLTLNAGLLGGVDTTLPITTLLLNRPRGVFKFPDPSLTSISLDTVEGVTVKLWGLYPPIPLVTPAQPPFTTTAPGATAFPLTRDGTAFADLSGMGSVALDGGAVGVRVDLVIPDSYGRSNGDPVEYFDIGRVQFGDINGVQPLQVLRNEHAEVFAVAPYAADVLYFTFSAGVVGVITVLLPNP